MNRRQFLVGSLAASFLPQRLLAAPATPSPTGTSVLVGFDYGSFLGDVHLTRGTRAVMRAYASTHDPHVLISSGELAMIAGIGVEMTGADSELAIHEAVTDGLLAYVRGVMPRGVGDVVRVSAGSTSLTKPMVSVFRINDGNGGDATFTVLTTAKETTASTIFGAAVGASPTSDIVAIAETIDHRWPATKLALTSTDNEHHYGLWSATPSLVDIPADMAKVFDDTVTFP